MNEAYSITTNIVLVNLKSVQKYFDDSLVSRYNNYLAPFKTRLKEFKIFTPQKLKTNTKIKIVYNEAKKPIQYTTINIYYNYYDVITDEEKERMGKKDDAKTLPVKGQSFIEWKNEEEEKANHNWNKILLTE